MRYEYGCTECNSVVDLDIPLANYRDKQFCMKCGTQLTRYLSVVPFKVKGFNAANGYSKGGKPPGY